MGKLVDLTGKRFGKLLVIGRAENKIQPSGQVKTAWRCICDCGNECIVSAYSLKADKSKSCGCGIIENAIKANKKEVNRYLEHEDYYELFNDKNDSFIISKADFEKVHTHRWAKGSDGYWFTRINKKNIRLHRFILNEEAECIDHINRNRNDNRRENLRGCSFQQNSTNKSLQSNNTSKIAGVQWYADRQKWMASLTYKKQYHYLGTYVNKEDAIRARLKAEKEIFGEYAPQKHLFESYGI